MNQEQWVNVLYRGDGLPVTLGVYNNKQQALLAANSYAEGRLPARLRVVLKSEGLADVMVREGDFRHEWVTISHNVWDNSPSPRRSRWGEYELSDRAAMPLRIIFWLIVGAVLRAVFLGATS
jgi:hypothetical protein